MIKKSDTVTIVGIKVNVKFKGIVQKWGNYRNAYTVTLKNQEEKSVRYTFYDSVYNTNKNIFVNDDLIRDIIQTLKCDYLIDADNFPTYTDFASEFGYGYSKEEMKIYKSCLSLSEKLKKVINQDWIDSIDVAEALS